MLNPKEWLQKALSGKELLNDGSEEIANEWLKLLETQEDLQAMLANKAFKEIMSSLERDFRSRMNELVMRDPDLAAIKKMFVRTIGLRAAEVQIQKQMVDYLQEEADVTQK